MIQLAQLGFDYGPKAVVFNGLTLNIPQGRSVGVLGANGVGKTTLIKLISGMVSPTQGSVSVLGSNPRLRPLALYQQMYVVPEESTLPSISALKYIQSFSVFYPAFNHALCTKMLEQFSVDLHKSLQKMSLGQKKKFIVSFALATGCQLILMDEPTNGLDIPSKALFREIVIEHQREDQTLLICTHQVKDLESIIDSVVMMNEAHALWIDLGELPRFVSQVSGAQSDTQVLYSEKRLGADISLIKGTTQQPTDIDLEILFNTFHTNYSGLNDAISTGATR
ncbi:ATP-binding cassette domain-containing protein [Reinekea sp.]|uniref:ATP-binding cassette domain-containing protein n=1 Tax=Reinekea sp. TaxID=1970455 RepID=UPI0039898D2F